MTILKRNEKNPLLLPNKDHLWEKVATFNGSVIKDNGTYHMVYRAVSERMVHEGVPMNLSTIGYAHSKDGVLFEDRRPLITPEYEWERFGCEDPRVTKIGDTFYIFYTAISAWPPNASSIKVGVALTKDFKTIYDKHLVTPFNAKAFALFPEQIGGKYWGILSANTDMPPSNISVISFDTIEQIWDLNYWSDWYTHLSRHTIPLQRNIKDQIEVGAVPVKIDEGWMVVYSYIKNYYAPEKIFGIEAMVLDKDNPLTLVAHTTQPLLVPEEYYELYGDVPNIVFPSGAIVENNELSVYYGSADTAVSVATGSMTDIRKQLSHPAASLTDTLVRFEGNPILHANQHLNWEATAVLNAAIVVEEGKIYIVYRAIGRDNISTMGYAVTEDGFHITERLVDPIYIPGETFEKMGCEDPRITRIDDTYYILYTAFDGSAARVAISSIAVSDFLAKQWKWSKPKIISPPAISDKDACVFPEKIDGRYWFLHRIDTSIWIDSTEDLSFTEKKWITGTMLFGPRAHKWDEEKIGIAGPPMKTDFGWLLIYHGISREDWKYRLGIVVLDLVDPSKVLYHMDNSILEPVTAYENTGVRPGTVFSCGQAVIDDILFVYYGAGDQSIGVARCRYSDLLTKIRAEMRV